MNKFIYCLVIITIICTIKITAQSNLGFNYQASAIIDGTPINGQINVISKLTTLKNNQDTILYSESHQDVLVSQGLFSLVIGHGVPLSGEFENVQWGMSSISLSIGLEYESLSYQLPSKEVMSVPKSKHSDNSSAIFSLDVNDNLVGTFSIGSDENGVGGDFNLFSNNEQGFAQYRFFRETNVTGRKSVQFLNGRNSTLRSAEIGVDGLSTFFCNDGGNFGIGTTTPKSKLEVKGWTTTEVLEITGGSDIAEKFQGDNYLEPGDVVVIDQKNPDRVLKSRKEYDNTVIGIVSGAGGIRSGLELKQIGKLDGNISVAIAGRVKVKTIGEVYIGDMLTTSNVPGYAQRIDNFDKGHGAIIGKALSVKDYNHLVLILVNIQ